MCWIQGAWPAESSTSNSIDEYVPLPPVSTEVIYPLSKDCYYANYIHIILLVARKGPLHDAIFNGQQQVIIRSSIISHQQVGSQQSAVSQEVLCAGTEMKKDTSQSTQHSQHLSAPLLCCLDRSTLSS